MREFVQNSVSLRSFKLVLVSVSGMKSTSCVICELENNGEDPTDRKQGLKLCENCWTILI